MTDTPSSPNTPPTKEPTRRQRLEELESFAEGFSAFDERMKKVLNPLAEQFAKLKLDFPSRAALGTDRISPPIYFPPTPEESNAFQGAAVLLKRLAAAITHWRGQLSGGVEPAIVAVLQGGTQVRVTRLATESFHGIRIDGEIDGTPCMILAHQSTVQLLCFPLKIEPERGSRRIGFIIDGEQSEA